MDYIPSFVVTDTQAQVHEADITYNEAGYTYNDSRLTYGGLTAQDQDVYPLLNTVVNASPLVLSTPTETPSLSIEERDNDALPLFTEISLTLPRIARILDIGSSIPPVPNNQVVVGPGWFMLIAQV